MFILFLLGMCFFLFSLGPLSNHFKPSGCVRVLAGSQNSFHVWHLGRAETSTGEGKQTATVNPNRSRGHRAARESRDWSNKGRRDSLLPGNKHHLVQCRVGDKKGTWRVIDWKGQDEACTSLQIDWAMLPEYITVLSLSLIIILLITCTGCGQ